MIFIASAQVITGSFTKLRIEFLWCWWFESDTAEPFIDECGNQIELRNPHILPL